MLTESGIVRSDITTSFGSSSGTAAGVPSTITLKVTDVAGAAMPVAAVYAWHCDRAGKYSLYDVEARTTCAACRRPTPPGTSRSPSDMVFGDDGVTTQLAAMTGTVGAGLTAALTVPVA